MCGQQPQSFEQQTTKSSIQFCLRQHKHYGFDEYSMCQFQILLQQTIDLG